MFSEKPQPSKEAELLAFSTPRGRVNYITNQGSALRLRLQLAERHFRALASYDKKPQQPAEADSQHSGRKRFPGRLRLPQMESTYSQKSISWSFHSLRRFGFVPERFRSVPRITV